MKLFLALSFFFIFCVQQTQADQELGKFLFSGPALNGWEIFVINGDGTGQKQLTETEGKAFNPKWSPDGSMFAYQLGNLGSDLALGLSRATGEKLETIQVKNKNINGFDWSPDGKKLYYAVCGDGQCQIFERNMEDQKEKCLLDKPIAMIAILACSPDGQKIAYVDDNDSSITDQAVVIDADTGKEIVRSKLTVNNDELPPNGGDGYLQAFILELKWTSDSKEIYFEREERLRQTYFMDVPSGNTRKWKKEDDEQLVWDPGNAFAVFSPSGTPGIYRCDLNGKNRSRLTKEGCWSGHPQFIDSGKKIAYQSNCDMDSDHLGNCSLYLMDLDDGSSRRVTPLILDAYKSSYSWHR